MDNIFGLSMNALLIAMLAMLTVALATVLYVALRNRIMFLIGVRNIPRRMAQTVLIVLGLMLSTLIITAAFTTGDTVNHSITKDVFRLLGHVDEIIEFESDDDVPAPDVSIPESTFSALEEEVRGDPNIDGLAPALAEQVPVVDLGRRQSAPNARFIGIDETRLEAFPDLEDLNGNPLDLVSLAEDEVFINESLADELDTGAGANITIFFENSPIPLRVAAVAKDRGITGSFGGFQNEGLVTRLDRLQALLDRPDELDFIVVSNTGGLSDGVDVTDEVEATLNGAFGERDLELSVGLTKQEQLEQAEAAGSGMLTFFLVLGLFSIAAGMLLIVMIFVMLAAERKSELGMARALGTRRWHLVESFLAEGMGYNLVAALVGAALGVGVAFALVSILGQLFSNADFDITIEPRATPRSLAVAYSLGVVLTFLTVSFSSWRVSRLNIVRAIRDLPEPDAKPGHRSLALALALSLPASLLIALGIMNEVAFPYALGVSLGFFAVAIVARYLGLPERPVFTTAGLLLLTFWVVTAGDLLPVVSGFRGGPEMFVLSGIVMVASASYVLVYNADLLLAVVAFASARLGRLLPAIRTAIAYPLASKFRTGMTLAMIALVVFALTMMSVMNSNFDRLFLNEENLGGWDIEVEENPNNTLSGGLTTALEASDGPQVDASEFAAVGSLGVAPLFGAELCQPDASDCGDDEEFGVYIVKGANQSFLQETTLPLQARARGFETDVDVWRAMASDPNFAVIDATALGGDFFDFGEGELFRLDDLDSGVTSFEPFSLQVRDSATGSTEPVQIVGITSLGASGGGDPRGSFFGLITSQELVQRVFTEPDFTNYFVRLSDDGRAEDVAHDIEAALLTTGAQANSIQKEREEESALFNSFFYLMQGFAGLGLFVGIAALGVVAFRSVVERRQQIGMLRAIGYTRGTVALTFILESTFVALLGVLSGIGLAILLATFLLQSDEFSAVGISGVYVPWTEVALIGLFAFGATLLMTFIPSRQAASVPIADALRYE